MDKRKAYQEKIKAQIEKVGAQIELLKAKVDDAKADAKIELNQRIENLEGQRDEVQKRLDELKSAGSSAWRELKSGVDSAVVELEKAVTQVMSNIK